MKINKDYFDNPIIPDYVLCKSNKERIGILKCSTKMLDIKHKGLNEITFSTYMNIAGKKNPYYDAIDVMKYILLPDYGFFSISECNIRSEGSEFEYKEVTARSFECLLAQKYLESFVINMGLVESIDGVSFYNIADPSKSLLNLVLNEKASEWKIGHVDASLMSMQRSFQIDRQDIYSFLTEDVATAFECIFLFDTLTNTINVYKEKAYGEDTNIHISYNNLLKNTNISCSIDDIKTCITPTGSDDLTIREVNMGRDRIYNLDFFHSTEYMSQGLYDSYANYKALVDEYKDEYTTLLDSYQDYYTDINFLTNEKMPDNPESTDWSEYGLVPLKEQLNIYEQKQSVMMKAGWGDKESVYYEPSYLPVYNTIQDINSQIQIIETELERLKSEQDVYYNQMFDIMNIVAMENNFTEEELAELNAFVREEELSTDNYIVTDIMTDEERFSMLNDFLEYSETELAKVAVPQLSFSANLANIFAIDAFSTLFEKFDVGNYIWITLRDDYHVRTNILEIHINFYELNDFTVTFGTLTRANDKVLDVMDRVVNAEKVATSVSFNQSVWNESAKNTDKIGQMIETGLLSSGAYLSSGVDSEMIIDNRGIFVNTTTGDYAGLDSIFLGGGRILFTDDNWKTVAMAVGRAEVNGQSRFGVFADFCIASYIAGSTIEGGTITGSNLNNGNGTFSVDENGKLIASDAHITKGEIGGAIIENNSIHASNGNWYIYADGTASFKNVYINGVQIGSKFGGVNIGNNGGTYGGFSNGFSASTSFGVSGGALNNFNDLVANKVTAAYIDATVQLSAKYATFDWVTANYLTANEIQTNYLTASEIKADYMEIDNWTSAGYIKAGKINADNITVGTLSANCLDIAGIVSALKSIRLACHVLDVETSLYLEGKKWTAREIDGITYLVEDR